jgi:hypothetical protein
LIATFISQQNSRTVILRDEQIGRAVAVVIACDDGARIFELNLVESDVGGDILETIGPRLRNRRTSPFPSAVSPTATRSTQPSLS